MIYGFARQSNGQVRIESELGRGTTVSMFLPRHLGKAAVDGARDELRPDLGAGRGETVLVVDDESSIRMLVVELLDELGYASIEAEDGAAGLRILRSGVPIDLLVTDVGMPGGITGRHLADAARSLHPELRVLFITGYTEAAVLSDARLNGVRVLAKPFSLELLAAQIRDLTAEGARPS